jgi:hypothetical protein
MLATQEAQTVQTRMTSCSICQRSVRVNPLKSTDVGVICRLCRCKRCSIPMSSKPCHRCGVAHGTPSARPGLCERCFETSAHHPMDSDSANDGDTLSDPLWPLHEVHSENGDREFLQ